jgi:tetratricopeptide (TPR) repeat protein
MKKFLTLLLLLATASLPASAAKKISKTLKKAHEATCSVMAYDADGTLIGTGQGFFVGERGELLAPYTLFLGARSAVATDAAGATRQVLKVKGANELYNVIRLSVETDKKQRTLAVDSVVLAVGQRLYLPPVSTAKKEAGDWLTVCKVQGISDGHSYYTLVGPSTPAQLAGRPLLTEEGQLAAVLQPSTEGDTLFYALDARFGAGLDIKALTLNEPSYRNLVFPKSLPEDVEQALVYLFVASNQNETTYYAEIVESFISQFPDNADGYIRRAALLVAEGDTSRFVQAEADQAKALELAENKDDIHYQISRQIINAVQADTAFHYSDWTLSRAAAETEKAIEINPLSVYWQQLGDIRYALNDGESALDAYLAICRMPDATSDNFYTAAVACEQLPDSYEQAVSLMDSAVVKASPAGATPDAGLAFQSAPYVLERALMKARNEKYRAAVADFNLYEKLAGTSVNDRFYYLREQAEASARMYQQALDDIDLAISINPLAVYLLEKASLNIRVSRIDDALPVLESLIAQFPNDVDCNRLLGYCYAVKGNKQKARPLLERAVSLGDDTAPALLERYCKP